MAVKKDRLCKWVKALESGEYEKTKRAFKRQIDENKNAFCSVGVACDIYEKETGEKLEYEKNNELNLKKFLNIMALKIDL